MLTPAPAPWIVRGATFALWALAAGSAAYWGLKLSSTTAPVAAPVAAPRQVGPVDPVALARMLGSSPAAAVITPAAPQVALASRFQLLGVAAGERSGGGAAVIAVDGKPARSYRVGSPIDEGLVLQSVHGRQAVIASREGQPLLTLELPQLRLDTSNRPAAPGTAAPETPAPSPRPRFAAPAAAPEPPQPVETPQAPTEAPR
ncbi:MAG TPA: type II secretion system protein N [Ramlibacter sp.]|uniref:type II secretion system protein N n=1 Tax=Ramlibacter sp. TaxID=1917967 RepID=UPI002D809AFF|nr:type II secretion system protein N [Ramlibacter sp.]HET8744781.1 type II secretion system protein N [Ramlibacter sp.]